jgi:hypothetical protein
VGSEKAHLSVHLDLLNMNFDECGQINRLVVCLLSLL